MSAKSSPRIELGPEDVRRTSWFGLKPALAKAIGAKPVNLIVQLAAARLLPNSVAHRLPLNRRAILYRLDDGTSVTLLDPICDTVAREIHWGGGKALNAAERHKLAALEQLSKTAELFIDIGAYAGLCSLIAARSNPRLRAIAYEIVPENFLLLARNVIENNLVERVEPRLCGIGAKNGALTLPARFGAASYMSSISLGSDFEDGVSIPVVRLDDQIRSDEKAILIKIDVEGFEDQVFEGATRLVSERRPDIICEILPGNHASARTITELLAPLGYRWFCFEDAGPQARDRIEPGQMMRDWLFTANPSVAAMLSRAD